MEKPTDRSRTGCLYQDSTYLWRQTSPGDGTNSTKEDSRRSREDFPEATQVLKDNTYMDDICDSVCTEGEAGELTKCIDSVIKTGGFKLKAGFRIS